MSNVTVKVKPIDSPWETIGKDTAKGIHPENVALEFDIGGSIKCSLDLRRDPKAILPDLGTLADLEIDDGPISRAWEGDIAETPTSGGEGRVIHVEGRGAQTELDDDIVEKVWAHDRLADYKDMRSSLTATLGIGVNGLAAACQVGNQDGLITLTFPAGQVATQYTMCGVYLDLGPGQAAARAILTYEAFGADANWTLFLRATDTPDQVWASYNDASTQPLTGVNSLANTISTPRRYVQVFLYRNGVTTTPTADVTVRIRANKAFSSTTYEAGGVSVLKADTVIKDVLDMGTLALSADRSDIDAMSFALPNAATDTNGNTPREMTNKVNAFHDGILKIRPGRLPAFYLKPSVPLLEVGAWTPFESDEDASANSIDEIYNRVIVRGTAPDGTPVRVERLAGGQPGVLFDASGGPVPTNPGFEVNTASWSVSVLGGSISRTTTAGQFDSGVAGGVWAGSGLPGSLTETITGSFKRGTTYALRFALKANLSLPVFGYFGDQTTGDVAGLAFPTNTSWSQRTLVWTPKRNTSSVTAVFNAPAFAGNVYIDSLMVSAARPTVLDKRGRIRTKILDVTSFSLPADGILAAQLGDTYLNNHRLTPFKGKCTVVGNRSIKNILTGEYLHLGEIGLRTGELLQFSDRADPDTGAWGRLGRLVYVTRRPGADSAELTIDNTRAAFEALLARLGVVISTG